MNKEVEEATLRRSAFRYRKAGELWVLSQADMDGLAVSYMQVLRVVEQAFISLRKGGSCNPLKTVIEPIDKHSIGYSMVGRDGASDTLGFKVVYEFDPQRTRNAYRFHSFIFLCDDATGEPIALMDVAKLGPLRTAATSALLAREAYPEARSALVVGTGVQGQIALPMLLSALPGLERLMVFGQYREGRGAVQKEVSRLYPNREVEIVMDLKTASAEADIVIGASGVSVSQLVRHAWLRRGSVAVLLGYGLHADVLHLASYRIATDTAQMHVTCGDLADSEGNIPAVDAELPDILLGRVPARRDRGDIVFAYNSGMVVTDVALGRYLADLARSDNRGVRVSLW